MKNVNILPFDHAVFALTPKYCVYGTIQAI
jgi:hypothetical protein